MKPKYEKPVALALGEAAKGSGSCKAGSGVIPGGAGGCVSGPGGTGPNCVTGSNAYTCRAGSTTSFTCSGGSLPNQDV